MKIINNQSGYFIYIVVVILLLLSTYTVTIIGANYRRSLPVINKINKLQASVCAYSGLSLIQAFASGYDGHDIHSEVNVLTKELDDAGIILISSWHDAGWLKVRSTGIRIKDTVCIEGILGQSPPQFTENVLNVFGTQGNLVVADRARVYGDIGTNGKGIVIKGSGIFKGKITRLDNEKYDDQSIDDEFDHVYDVFKERKVIKYLPDSLLPVKIDNFKEVVSQKKGDIFIEGNLNLIEKFDFYERVLWIDGDLFITHNAEIKNIKANVTGSTYISGKAFLELGSIICFENIKITDKAHIRLNVACAETLMVSRDALVEYPSILYLSSFLQRKSGRSKAVLLVLDNAHIIGTILSGVFDKSSFLPRLYISGRSCTKGILYSPSPVTINGRLSGNVSVNKLIYDKPGSVYDGWLMEVTLLEYDLSEMVIPLVFPENCKPRYLYTDFKESF